MKHKIYLIAFLMIGVFATSCSSDDDLDHQNDFKKSQKAWLDFKQASENSYTYKVVGGSWTRASWETNIAVVRGKVVQRHFKYTSTEGMSDIPQEALEWTENEADIGTHKNQGAEALTLDEIYNKAETEWLIKRKNAKAYFESENNGLISSCGYVVNGCMDDCFVGIRIESIGVLKDYCC